MPCMPEYFRGIGEPLRGPELQNGNWGPSSVAPHPPTYPPPQQLGFMRGKC